MKANPSGLSRITQCSRLALLRRHCKSATVVLFLLLILSVTSAYCQIISGVPGVADDWVSSAGPIFNDSVLRGIELAFNDQIGESLVIFERLELTYPDHPAPHFFKAAAYQSYMSSFRINRFQKELEENVQLAIAKGNKLLERKDDPWLHFYVGGAYGYRAFNRFRKHDWIGAYLDGKRGIKNFKQALLKEPNLFDVYLGLGLYHYWRTAKSKFIGTIAFWIPDKRELGLRQLEFAIDHGLYAPNEASYALVAACFDYGQYEKAMSIYDRTIARKRVLTVNDLYYKARLLIEFGRWSDVESLFKRILQQLEDAEFASVGYQVECKYWIASALVAQNRSFEALGLLRDAIAQSTKRNPNLELQGPFESFTEIKKRLDRLQEESDKVKSIYSSPRENPLSSPCSYPFP